MFPYPIAKPQKCDIQTFYGSNVSGGTNRNAKTWNKPVGVSHVYMMLIGGGGNGDGTTGGGSGAVTVWYGAAQHVPNSLLVTPATNAADSVIYYRGNSLVGLISAGGASGTTGGAAISAGPFLASGFYKSTAGQDGSSGTVSASTTTFLSGGTIAATVVNSNYGYQNAGSSASTAATGYFQLQPIIVGVGSSGTFDAHGAVGCGGGSQLGTGGPGMVLIASW